MCKRNYIFTLVIFLQACGSSHSQLNTQTVSQDTSLDYNNTHYLKQDIQLKFKALYVAQTISFTNSALNQAKILLNNTIETIDNKLSLSDMNIFISPINDSAATNNVLSHFNSDKTNIIIQSSVFKSIINNGNSSEAELALLFQVLKSKYQSNENSNNINLIEGIKFISLAHLWMQANNHSLVWSELPEIEQSTYLSFLLESNNKFNFETQWFSLNEANYSLKSISIMTRAIDKYIADHPAATIHNIWQIPASKILIWYDKSSREVKTNPYVRTPNIDEFDQVPDYEFSRQAIAFPKLYFLEGLHNEKQVSLTFDDGPSQYSQPIINVLKSHNIKATFFVMGQNISSNTQVLKNIAAQGHTIAHHSWSHPDTSTFENNDTWWQQEFEPTNNLLNETIGYRAAIFRPPYGRIRDDQIKYLAQKGILVVNWSVDTRDWNSNTNSVKNIENAVLDNQHSEAIILMHDGGGNRNNTATALSKIIESYQAQGYKFVTVDKLLGVSKSK